MPRTDDYVTRHPSFDSEQLWTDVEANAAVLIDEIEPLDWSARAAAIDWFIWQVGTKLLSQHAAEAVIERNRAAMHAAPAIERFVDVAQRTLAAVLTQLDPTPARPSNAFHAVLLALAPVAEHQEVFEAWMDGVERENLAAAFGDLPGHAFLCLASTYDDTFTAMLARDGFRRSMLGENTGF